MKEYDSNTVAGGDGRSEQKEAGWREYEKTKDPELRQQLILENVRLVYYAYGRMKAQLPPGMEREDAIGYGITGLIEAVDRYEVEKGRFSSLAFPRIQGAIYDGMMSFQWMRRHDKRKDRQRASAGAEDEPAEEKDASGWQRILVPLEEGWNVEDVETAGPEKWMMEENNRVVIGQALSKLEEREEEILRRYYFDGQTMRQIARETGRSTSRVSELHKKGLSGLRARIRRSEIY